MPPRCCCWSITDCTWNCTSTARTPSAAMMPPASAMWCWSPRSRRFKICEDSVAAVDAARQDSLYRNWLGLMNGSLQARVEKDGKPLLRRLNADRRYLTPEGADLVLPGRSLMLVRNVGHHMMSDAVTLDGRPIPETFIDAAVTALIALHDLRGEARGAIRVSDRSTSSSPRCTGPTRRRSPTNCSPRSRTCWGSTEIP